MKNEPRPAHAAPTPLPKQLRCPKTGKPLELDSTGQWANVAGEPLRYPVRKGIPVLVASAAETTG